MSGIIGIFNLDGAPIDRALLERLTKSLSFRGPHAQRIWFRGQIGLGHTLLRTEGESVDQQQIVTLDENSWIAADARVDGREDLTAALRSHGQDCLPQASDAELILRAYRVWGRDCVQRLIGDFVFAIWDSRSQCLFCARDQMGVKPFFYSRVGTSLIFSNTLDCIRRHPAVSARLNDLSIADFLLFELIQDPAATSFAGVQRLPPAHAMHCAQGNVSVRRYWSPAAVPPVHYRRPSDYVDRFHELLDAAVADRLHSDSACVFMSGGLDSPTVAASATRASARGPQPCSVWAFTQVFDRLIPHEERHYAGLVAEALKIPIEYRADDGLRLFQFARQPGYHSPEPVNTAWPDATNSHLQRVASVSRVVLTGFGADPLFAARISVHFRQLLGQHRFGRALADAARYLTLEGRFSRLYLKTRWRILFGSKETHSGFFPPWLNREFAQKFLLRERWHARATEALAPADAARSEAFSMTFAPLWSSLFESYDAGCTRVPVEVRHPFFDLRLMNYLLGLPRLPWCCDKQLLREAGRDVLPNAVRLRRKSPLPADPLLALLEAPGAAGAVRFDPLPELEHFVTMSRVPQAFEANGPWAPWVHLRPLSLNYWLRGLGSSVINGEGGVDHELSVAGQS